MTAIYEVTMLLAIALLAIVVTVFVLAASLLGRAIEEAGREQKEIKERQARQTEETINNLKKSVTEAEKSGDLERLGSLGEDLEKSLKMSKRFQKELRCAAGRYQPLTARGSVLYPGILFLVALGLAGGARYVTTVPVSWAAYLLWGLSLVVLVFGCYRVYGALKEIERLAVTTEEAQHRKTVAALMSALELHEQGKVPVLEFEFVGKEPPFVFKRNSTEKIKCRIDFRQAKYAERVSLWLKAPKCFGFPRMRLGRPLSDDVIVALDDLGDLMTGMRFEYDIVMTTPNEPGTFDLSYGLTCKGNKTEGSFKVVVS